SIMKWLRDSLNGTLSLSDGLRHRRLHLADSSAPRLAENGRLWNIWTARSLRFDARELYHLGPFLGFLGDELAKIGGRTREHCTSQIGEARLHGGIGESGINFLVELLDNIYGRGLGSYDPIPASRLVAWQKFTHGRNLRQKLLTLCRGHCQCAQLAGLDVPQRRRHDAEHGLQLPANQIGQCEPLAAVRNVDHVNAGHHFE